MIPELKDEISQEVVIDFCRKWQIEEFSLFGSILRDDFHQDSDIDILLRFAPVARHSLFDLVNMQDELRVLFGREVNLVERTTIESSCNYLRRKAILENAETIYAV